MARERLGFGEGELRTITRTAIEASFADDAVKSALLNRLTANDGPREPLGSPTGRVPRHRRSSGSAPTSSFHRSRSLVGGRPRRGRLRLGQHRARSSSSAAGLPASTSTPAAKKIKVGLVTDIGGLNDRSFNQLANAGLTQSEKDARHRGPRAALEVQRGLHPEPVDAGPAELRPGDRRRLPDGGRDGHRGHEVPEHQVRDHRRRRHDAEGQADERRRACCSRSRRRATSPATWRACT